METTATREALLDAAEELFAEQGIEGTSLRTVTGKAGANVAAVHYYFGSKEGLIREVFARRLAPLADNRLARLAACGEPGEQTLECILRAFVEPFVELGWRMDQGSSATHLTGRLIAQVLLEPADFLRNALADAFRETFVHFADAFERALPHLDHSEVIARLNFSIGTMIHGVAGIRLYQEEHDALPRSEELVDRLVTFLVAALQAPATLPRTTSGPDEESA